MDEDDLENTMRHGLEELANDAPRGEGLWHTTTSMIAIQPDAPPPPGAEPEEKPAPTPPRNLALEPRDPPPAPTRAPDPGPQSQPPMVEPPAPRNTSGLALGIAIGVAIGALIVAVIAIVLLIRNNNDSSPKRGGDTPAVTQTSVASAPAVGHKPGPATTAVLPKGPIPAGDVVFNDESAGRIVVADSGLNEIGLIVPSSDGPWRALQVSADRTHIYVAKTAGEGKCDELWDEDLRTRKLTPLVQNANIVALAPDASRAVVSWDETCNAGLTPGTVALQVFGQEGQAELKEVSRLNRVNVAWSPDGTRFSVEPAASHHVDTYDKDGRHLADFDRPRSSQDGIGWSSDGLLLVDAGFDKSAIVRTYNSLTGDVIGEIGRVPEVKVGGDTGPLTTPQVTTIRQVGERTYVEVAGGADSLSYAQLRVVNQGKIPVIIDGWYSRHFVG